LNYNAGSDEGTTANMKQSAISDKHTDKTIYYCFDFSLPTAGSAAAAR
jgi:hypothetical protein